MGHEEAVSYQPSAVSEAGTHGVPAVDLALAPGRVFGLEGPVGSGLTSVGFALLAAAGGGGPVAVLDGRGWFCPSVAWGAGIEPERLVVVRCPDVATWPRVAATLVEGFPVVYADAPRRVPGQAIRRLGALARSRGTGVVLRSASAPLPSGVLHLRIEPVGLHWEGTDRGHGRLHTRVMTLKATGKGARGLERYLEVVDDGSNALRLVSGLAATASRRAAG